MASSPITKDTKVSIGLTIALVSALASGFVWIKDSINKNSVQLLLIDQRLKSIELSVDQRFDRLRDSIEDNAALMYTRAEMIHWSDLLQADNHDVKVPDIR